MKCPSCYTPITPSIKTHCDSDTCPWVRCECRVIYDRKTGRGFKQTKNVAITYPPAS